MICNDYWLLVKIPSNFVEQEDNLTTVVHYLRVFLIVGIRCTDKLPWTTNG